MAVRPDSGGGVGGGKNGLVVAAIYTGITMTTTLMLMVIAVTVQGGVR